MPTISVLSTKDYARFKTIPGNRNINRSHVNKLIASIKSADFMQYQPILVTTELFVIDGQHRLEAARTLKREVFYTVLPNSDLVTVQLLNVNIRAWSIRDFCLSYAEKGNSDYAQLLEFADTNDVSLSFASGLLSRKQSDGGGSTARAIRSGSFRIWNKSNAEEMMRRLKEISVFLVGDFWKTTAFVFALVTLYSKGVEHELLREQLRSTGKRIFRQVNARDYMIELIDVYNYGLKKKRIQLF